MAGFIWRWAATESPSGAITFPFHWKLDGVAPGDDRGYFDVRRQLHRPSGRLVNFDLGGDQHADMVSVCMTPPARFVERQMNCDKCRLC